MTTQQVVQQVTQRQGVRPALAPEGPALAALQAAFRQPRFLGEPRTMLPVPLLFWLVDALRPERALVLGAGEGSLFFALAQAMDRLERPDGQCQGFGFWPAEGSGGGMATRVPTSLRNHLRQLYPDLAELQAAPDPATALQGQRAGSLDLLLIDLGQLPPAPTPSADSDSGPDARLDARLGGPGWRHLLRPRGLVLLHGTLDAPQVLASDAADGESGALEFRLGAGLALLPQGKLATPILASPLAPLHAPNHSGQPAPELEQLFRHLGQGLEATARQGREERAAAADRSALAALRNDKAEAGRTLTELRAAYDQRSLLLARTQAELFQLRGAEDRLQRQVHQLDEALHEAQAEVHNRAQAAQAAAQALQAEQAQLVQQRDKLQAKASALAAQVAALQQAQEQADKDRAALRDEIARAEAARTEQAREMEALANKLQATEQQAAAQAERAEAERSARFRETAALTGRLEELQRTQDRAEAARLRQQQAAQAKAVAGQAGELAQAQAEAARLQARVDELLASTSWRLTAPLRWVKLRLSR